MLPALEFHVWEQVRVLVVKVDNVAHIHLIVLKVVHERAAAVLPTQRPAHCVGHLSLLVVLWFDLPDLFHAETEFWDITVSVEVELLDDLLAQRSACAFRQEHVLAVKFHAWLIVRARRAIRVLAKFASDNTLQRTVFAKDHFGTRHAGENFNTQTFGLFRQPTANISHGDDVHTVIVHQRRHHHVWQSQGACFA